MTIALLELASVVLGPLVDDVVFVGGATLEVHTTDPAAPPARPTDDIDVVVKAATRVEYEAFADRLHERGLVEDSSSSVICRWRHSRSPIVLDVMPTAGSVFGFSNRWYPEVMREPVAVELPSLARGLVVRPALLLATKLEAYGDRGSRDPIASRDLADIVMLIDRRPELLAEVSGEPSDVRSYIAQQAKKLQGSTRIIELVSAHLPPDDASQARAGLVVLPRLAQLAQSL